MSGVAGVICFPETAADVQVVVRTANGHRVPFVARGSGTGLAGGAVPPASSTSTSGQIPAATTGRPRAGSRNGSTMVSRRRLPEGWRGYGPRSEKRVEHQAVDALEGDFYLCGPSVFMDLCERALAALHVPSEQIHIERFVSPPDPDDAAKAAAAAASEVGDAAPTAITVVLDGKRHEVPYERDERVLEAARRAGLLPPFSCEEGYCSCCMAKLTRGRVRMASNDCLTPELLEEGWILTCQSVCLSPEIEIEYPD